MNELKADYVKATPDQKQLGERVVGHEVGAIEVQLTAEERKFQAEGANMYAKPIFSNDLIALYAKFLKVSPGEPAGRAGRYGAFDSPPPVEPRERGHYTITNGLIGIVDSRTGDRFVADVTDELVQAIEAAGYTPGEVYVHHPAMEPTYDKRTEEQRYDWRDSVGLRTEKPESSKKPR